VGIMYSGPTSPRFNAFDLYIMGLMGYQEVKTYTYQVGTPDPTSKLYPLTIDTLITGMRISQPGNVEGAGVRTPEIDPSAATLRTLVVLVRGRDEPPVTPAQMSAVKRIAAEIPAGWSTATWGRSQMTAQVVRR